MLNSYLNSFGFRLVPTNSKPLLLRRPVPDSREGFGEYLTRLCSENRLDGPKGLAMRLGLTYGQLVELGSESFRHILCGDAKLVFPKPGEVVRPISGKELFLRGVRTQTRVCPLCLSDGGVAYQSWSWPLTLACDRHGSWLLDSCPRCSEEVSLLRQRQFACDCGYDYRFSKVHQAEHWLEIFHEIFSPHRFSQPNDAGAILKLDQRAYLILRSLLASTDKKLDIKLRQVAGMTLSLMRSDQLDGLREMVLNWSAWIPQRMECLAEANIESARRLIRQMRELGSSELLSVANEASDAIDARRKADRSKARFEDLRIRSIQELSRITGLNERTIMGFISKGYIRTSSITESNAGLHFYEISEEESERIRQLYESTLSLSEVAQWFDVDAIHIKIFAKANVLKPVFRHSNHVITWRFDKKSLDLFLTSLQGNAVTVTKNIELADLISISSLTIKHQAGCPNTSWVRFAGRIASSEIPVFRLKDGRGLNSLAVRTSDLPRARGKR